MQNETHFIQLHSKELVRALKKREEFFARLEGQHLARALELQQQIDEELRKAGNQNNRLVVINKLMMDSLRELNKLLHDLSRYQ